MKIVFSIAAGGAVGAVARHFVSGRLLRWLGPDFPYGTLAVNILGSFAMGILVGMFAHFWDASQEMRAFLTVGLLGAFTTFSAFSLDTVTLFERGAWVAAATYIVSSVLFSLGGLFAGVYLSRMVFPS